MKKNIFTKDNLMFFIILNLGLIFTAVGIAIFKTPNHFAFGGTSGLSIILSTLFPKWNVGAFMWIVNAALVVLGFFFLGIRSMGWTVYSSFALSFYVSACEAIYPLSSPLTHDVFLELCFAVILPAVGAAMVFNVGDNALNMEIMEFLLNDVGVKVTKAADGQQAVEAFAASSVGGFDAILMDVMMPVRDGHEATRAIRAMDRPDAKTIPIFAMTANAFTEDRRKALESGMNEHLPKPIDPDALYRLLVKYLTERS